MSQRAFLTYFSHPQWVLLRRFGGSASTTKTTIPRFVDNYKKDWKVEKFNTKIISSASKKTPVLNTNPYAQFRPSQSNQNAPRSLTKNSQSNADGHATKKAWTSSDTNRSDRHEFQRPRIIKQLSIVNESTQRIHLNKPPPALKDASSQDWSKKSTGNTQKAANLYTPLSWKKANDTSNQTSTAKSGEKSKQKPFAKAFSSPKHGKTQTIRKEEELAQATTQATTQAPPSEKKQHIKLQQQNSQPVIETSSKSAAQHLGAKPMVSMPLPEISRLIKKNSYAKNNITRTALNPLKSKQDDLGFIPAEIGKTSQSSSTGVMSHDTDGDAHENRNTSTTSLTRSSVFEVLVNSTMRWTRHISASYTIVASFVTDAIVPNLTRFKGQFIDRIQKAKVSLSSSQSLTQTIQSGVISAPSFIMNLIEHALSPETIRSFHAKAKQTVANCWNNKLDDEAIYKITDQLQAMNAKILAVKKDFREKGDFFKNKVVKAIRSVQSNPDERDSTKQSRNPDDSDPNDLDDNHIVAESETDSKTRKKDMEDIARAQDDSTGSKDGANSLVVTDELDGHQLAKGCVEQDSVELYQETALVNDTSQEKNEWALMTRISRSFKKNVSDVISRPKPMGVVEQILSTPVSERLAEYKFWFSGSGKKGAMQTEELTVISDVMWGASHGRELTAEQRKAARKELHKLNTKRRWASFYPTSLQKMWKVGGNSPNWHYTNQVLCEPRITEFRSPIMKETLVLKTADEIKNNLLTRFGTIKQLECRTIKSPIFQKFLQLWATFIVENYEYPHLASTPYCIPPEVLTQQESQNLIVADPNVAWLIHRIQSDAKFDCIPLPYFNKHFRSPLDWQPLEYRRLQLMSKYYGHLKWPFIHHTDAKMLKQKII